jgi:cell division protein FtsL
MSVSVRVANTRQAKAPALEGLSLKRVLVLLAVVISVALFYAFASVRAQNLSYQVSRELETQRELRETGRRLQVELNILRAPERLERIGARLGLGAPEPKQMRLLK